MFVRAVDEMLNLFTAPLMPLMETNPLRRGRPLCPPEGFDFALALSRVVLSFIDVNAPLAGWMHRPCADLAGCYGNPVWCLVRLRWFVT